jgi:hypothetical protein
MSIIIKGIVINIRDIQKIKSNETFHNNIINQKLNIIMKNNKIYTFKLYEDDINPCLIFDSIYNKYGDLLNTKNHYDK